MNHLPTELKELFSLLKKFPGVGKKTAERFGFSLLEWREEELKKLGALLHSIKNKIEYCHSCGLMLIEKKCFSCHIHRRDPHLLCVVATPKEALTIEESAGFSGAYHVLGGLLSPIDGKSAEDLNLTSLFTRLKASQIEEVILAFDSTLEGDATALFLREKLTSYPVKVTRPALGLPMGSRFEYVDEGTLMRSLLGRQSF